MAHKAPGKHFRTGLSLVEVMRMFPDDATAEQWFIEQRWPNGAHCPNCGSVNVQSGAAHKTMSHRCRDCRKWFSVKTGTVMQSSKLGLQAWALATYLLNTGLKGQSSMKLHRDLGITQKTAWHLAHHIRETWAKKNAPMFGPVEVDETFIGGKEKNKHAHKKLKAGRGAVGKAIVVGAKDRNTNRVSAAVVGNTDAKTLQGFVGDHAAKGATVYTDDHGGYQGMPFEHETVKHSISAERELDVYRARMRIQGRNVDGTKKIKQRLPRSNQKNQPVAQGKVGRPVERSMPDPIPDTPENIARALLTTPPKKEGDWDYLKDAKDQGTSKPRAD